MKYPENAFDFKRCTADDLPAVCALQDKVLEALKDPNLLRKNSREMLTACLKEPHYTVGAFHHKQLIAFAVLFDGQNTDENIGNDIPFLQNQLENVINFKLVIVSPAYWGNRLQQRLGVKLEEVAKEKGKQYICATASPLNVHSCRNFEHMQYALYGTKEKYGHLLRNIYYKKLV